MNKSGNRRERRKQEVRSRIVEAAVAAFSEKNWEEVTVDRICEHADVARKTFYNYYPSKQHLLDELSQSLLVEEAQNHMELAFEKFDNTEARLKYFFGRMANNMSDYEILERNLVTQAMFDVSANVGKSGEQLEAMNLEFERL